MRQLLRHAIALLALAILPLPALRAAEPAADAPEASVNQVVAALRDNDFLGFFKSLPAEEQAKAEKGWKEGQQDPAKRAEFDEFLGKLLAPDAVDQMMANAEPGLAGADLVQQSQSLKMMAGFLPMMAQMPGPDGKPRNPTPELTQAVQMGQTLLNDVADWLPTSGLNDPAKLREALTHLVDGAKALGVKNSEELRALELTEFLTRLSPLVKEAKAAFNVYGLDADKFLASVTATSTGAGGERTMNLGFTAFGRPYSVPVKMTKKDGKWVAADQTMAKGFDAFSGFMDPAEGGQEGGPVPEEAAK